MSVAGGDRGHTREAGWHVALPVVAGVTGGRAATPGDHGAVALQCQAVGEAGGNRGHSGQAAWDVALPEVGVDVLAALAPGDHRAVGLQCQGMTFAGRDSRHVGEVPRHVACSFDAE